MSWQCVRVPPGHLVLLLEDKIVDGDMTPRGLGAQEHRVEVYHEAGLDPVVGGGAGVEVNPGPVDHVHHPLRAVGLEWVVECHPGS